MPPRPVHDRTLFETLLAQARLRNPDVRSGAMFGSPALFLGRRMIGCVFGGNIGLKVTAATATRRLQQVRHRRSAPMASPPCGSGSKSRASRVCRELGPVGAGDSCRGRGTMTSQPLSEAERRFGLAPGQFPFASHFAEVNGARLHYVDEGSGRPCMSFPGTSPHQAGSPCALRALPVGRRAGGMRGFAERLPRCVVIRSADEDIQDQLDVEAMMMAAMTPASSGEPDGGDEAPIFARSRVNMTSGTMAKGSWKASTTWLRISSMPVPSAP